MASTFDSTITYRIATDRQATLREEAFRLRIARGADGRPGAPLPPTRGPLAALRRRLAGSASFA